MELQHRRKMSLKIDMETIRSSFRQNELHDLLKIVRRYSSDEDVCILICMVRSLICRFRQSEKMFYSVWKK